ncbi:Inactive receptor-like protein kinase [Quillaja saponaria]|uniref:Inactive receptor-like protein kinase n=1 Tax=Quillaja saponaria TaxID=32244 RepID=A0AAD7LKM4_QUISA|nr:Inactive receptor-like protein kinase [Quillaja saponaria]
MDEWWRFNQLKLHMVVFIVVVSLFPWNVRLGSSLNSEGEGIKAKTIFKLFMNFGKWVLFCESKGVYCLDAGLALLKFRDRIIRDPFGALSNWNGDGGVLDPCSWFGVECSDGKVVTLILKDLCLKGTLAPEIEKLAHIKSIILRNNSFFGEIPKEIGVLKELEILDLGYNNFSGTFPSDLGSNLSLTTLLLDNNDYLGNNSPELHELRMVSEFHVDEYRLRGASMGASSGRRSTFWDITRQGDIANRRILQVANAAKSPRTVRNEDHSSISLPPSPSPSSSTPSSLSSPPTPLPNSPSPSIAPFPSQALSHFLSPLNSPEVSPSPSPLDTFLTPSSPPVLAPTPGSSIPTNPPAAVSAPPQPNLVTVPSPASIPSQADRKSSKTKHLTVTILATVGGFSLFIVLSATAFVCFRSKRAVTVKPWATGLSGQLQKAFVTGIPSLKRSELEAACEDFSNIIGSFSDGTVYKGTLSSGVEIAVSSTAVTSSKNWSKNMELQFRKKIETLSQVNHKNFVNLIGYCEEEKPFTRMMIFEYAPNGTLFEHLYIKEAEQLDWGMRLRIAMGMAYCLEHMHQLTPPIAHRNLQSSSVYLTEDYASKIADFGFWNEVDAAKKGSPSIELLETTSAVPEANVYSFGVILFEMVTRRLPYFGEKGSHVELATEYLGKKPLREIVDPTLESFQAEELQSLFQVIKDCVRPNPEERPTMKEVAARLKDITGMDSDVTTPKLSLLWWAEKEISFTDES